VVSIFAREITDDLTSLVKKIDEVVGKNEDKQMAAFLVLLTDDPDAAKPKLKKLAEKNGIKNVPLTVFDGIAGPESLQPESGEKKAYVAKDSDVTVLMWSEQTVKVSHSLAKDKLDNSAIEKIVAKTAQILN